METPITRRQFALSSAAAAGAAVLGMSFPASAAPKSSSGCKPSQKAYSAVKVKYVPGVFESRYSDLGGVLDTTTGVVWGYEPYASLVNQSSNYQQGQVNDSYLALLAGLASVGTEEQQAIFEEAFAVASEFTWRWPTVCEARDAVTKGLFTFGSGGCNLYYGSPLYDEPGVSYGLGNLRWSSSEGKAGLIHLWSAADGGTMLASKSSSAFGIVVAQLT